MNARARTALGSATLALLALSGCARVPLGDVARNVLGGGNERPPTADALSPRGDARAAPLPAAPQEARTYEKGPILTSPFQASVSHFSVLWTLANGHPLGIDPGFKPRRVPVPVSPGLQTVIPAYLADEAAAFALGPVVVGSVWVVGETANPLVPGHPPGGVRRAPWVLHPTPFGDSLTSSGFTFVRLRWGTGASAWQPTLVLL